MLSFESDYTEGAHERILKRLIETNLEQTPGYGSDNYCEQAKEKIRRPADVRRQRFPSLWAERRRMQR